MNTIHNQSKNQSRTYFGLAALSLWLLAKSQTLPAAVCERVTLQVAEKYPSIYHSFEVVTADFNGAGYSCIVDSLGGEFEKL